MRILVAENDAISRSLLERTLQRAGYDVIAVADGMHALLELGKSDAPRLALLDWIMPVKDGVKVCRVIRRQKERALYLSPPAVLARVERGHRGGPGIRGRRLSDETI